MTTRFGLDDDYKRAGECERGVLVKPVSEFALAVDLGQANDPTALCLLERRRNPLDPSLPDSFQDYVQKLSPTRYIVRYLERLPLNLSYFIYAGMVREALSNAPQGTPCLIDKTGPGRPVLNIFQEGGINPVSVTIVAGDKARQENSDDWYVGKQTLASTLQAHFHLKAISIPKTLPDAAALVAELQSFRMMTSENGYRSFSAASGKHDDLTLALSIALWWLVPRPGNHWSSEPLFNYDEGVGEEERLDLLRRMKDEATAIPGQGYLDHGENDKPGWYENMTRKYGR